MCIRDRNGGGQAEFLNKEKGWLFTTLHFGCHHGLSHLTTLDDRSFCFLLVCPHWERHQEFINNFGYKYHIAKILSPFSCTPQGGSFGLCPVSIWRLLLELWHLHTTLQHWQTLAHFQCFQGLDERYIESSPSDSKGWCISKLISVTNSQEGKCNMENR